jgi:hypothetical protein
MTLAEALAAATINSAHSLGRGHTHGSIEVGKVRSDQKIRLTGVRGKRGHTVLIQVRKRRSC